MDTVVHFFSGKNEYRSLSNFWESDIIIVSNNSQRQYETGEHCFHGEKYTRLGELCEDDSRRKLLLDYGKTFTKPTVYQTAGVSKKMGGKRGLLLTQPELFIWNNISATVQVEICKFKFDNYQEVRDDLLHLCTFKSPIIYFLNFLIFRLHFVEYYKLLLIL
jgi:predicted NAD-dependent protein-ADP-ribosyltransferase YbiA (DUF1768 family)